MPYRLHQKAPDNIKYRRNDCAHAGYAPSIQNDREKAYDSSARLVAVPITAMAGMPNGAPIIAKNTLRTNPMGTRKRPKNPRDRGLGFTGDARGRGGGVVLVARMKSC